MTYNKRLKTLKVYLMLDSEPITIADTDDDDKATRALNEFKKYGSMHYETEEGSEKVTNEIPYHAVQYIEVTDEGGGGGDKVTITITKGCSDQQLDPVEAVTTFKVTKGVETLMPFDENTVRVACTCFEPQYFSRWKVADGDATIRRGDADRQFYITANEDASIYPVCQRIS